MEYNIGQKYEHKTFGYGKIIKDVEETCRENEVMFESDDPMPSGIQYSAKWAGWIDNAHIDIVLKNDLKIMQ